MRQRLRDFDLLVLDNASTDGSQKWLRDFSAGEPRMQFAESDVNLGFSAAHNRHILAAHGDVQAARPLHLFGADAVGLPGALEERHRQLPALRRGGPLRELPRSLLEDIQGIPLH